MKITTLWLDEGDGPYLLDSYDEATFDAWGNQRPASYHENCLKHPTARELEIEIPDAAVDALFATPTVTATA